MAQVAISDPDRVETVEVDEYGRVYVGTALAGCDVELVLSVVEESESDDESNGGERTG